MILRIGSPRSVKQLQRQPALRTIPEDESCFDENSGRSNKCRSVGIFEDPAALMDMERVHRNLRPFDRSLELDYLARIHVMRLAAAQSVFHSVTSIGALQAKLLSEKVGENIQRGDSICSMHKETMAGASVNRSNILSIHFDEFGSATAIGDDEKVYCCQYFRKRGSTY